MMLKAAVISIIYSTIFFGKTGAETASFTCDRKPVGIYKPANIPESGRYILQIEGKPQQYVPLETYKVSIILKGYPDEQLPYKFLKFIITLRSKRMPDDQDIIHQTGEFQLGNDMLTQFSTVCPHTVVEKNVLPKAEVSIYWKAPPPGSGCVAIQAAVIESKESWFKDGEYGPLSQILCEDTSDNEDTLPEPTPFCSACDEAKYELQFEGNWIRNTFPKDFPKDPWSTQFSDIIGSSHKYGGAFWEEGSIASKGLVALADTGSTETLETELIQNLNEIHTIIKAKGLKYPNMNGSTYSVFRVDNENHLITLVAKFMPSPDWFVGVSNLDLCMPDGTWRESKTLNLYPFDAGTDDALTYTDREPSRVPKPIKQISSTDPNDEDSPFYDPNGGPLKPIAKLHVTLQKLYKKECDPDREKPDNCAIYPWGPWSQCSKRCGEGEGVRRRQRLNVPAENINECMDDLVQERKCYGDCSGRNKEDVDQGEECAVGEWTKWSSCSVNCGLGHRTRSRKLTNSESNDCKDVELQKTEECGNRDEKCDDELPPCDNLEWSPWTPCNVTCGTGYKERFGNAPDDNNDDDECRSEVHEVVACEETQCDIGGFPHLWIANYVVGPVEACEVSPWVWSSCDIGKKKCGNGYKTRTRTILRHPMNGGKACPKKLFKRKPCYIPCK